MADMMVIQKLVWMIGISGVKLDVNIESVNVCLALIELGISGITIRVAFETQCRGKGSRHQNPVTYACASFLNHYAASWK